jgi:hypothetical protein
MKRVSIATRNELVVAIAERYARSRRGERGRILDEFVGVTGLHRKHAMRVRRGGRPGSGDTAVARLLAAFDAARLELERLSRALRVVRGAGLLPAERWHFDAYRDCADLAADDLAGCCEAALHALRTDADAVLPDA